MSVSLAQFRTVITYCVLYRCGDGRAEPLYLCVNDPLLLLTAPDSLTPFHYLSTCASSGSRIEKG